MKQLVDNYKNEINEFIPSLVAIMCGILGYLISDWLITPNIFIQDNPIKLIINILVALIFMFIFTPFLFILTRKIIVYFFHRR
jgi:ABC-type Fe3+-siderophore transport system permease subunit